MKHSFDAQTSRAMNREEVRSDESDVINLDEILVAARRQWKIVAVSTVAFLALGVVYIVTAVPKYESSTSILIDPGNQQIVDRLAELTGGVADESSVLSQVEIVSSEKVARAVSESLNLRFNPQFMQQGSSIQQVLAFVKGLVGGSDSGSGAEKSDEVIQQGIIATLTDDLRVARVGRSYVLSLSYTSANAELSAQIVRAFANAYLADLLASKKMAAQRAADWMQEWVGNLRQKAMDSDTDVQKFIAEKNLLSTGGQLVLDQQLTQINAQLIDAQGATSRAESQLQNIEAAVANRNLDATVADALGSPVINKLRDQFLAASRTEADISSRLGSEHTQAVKLRRDMAEYQRLMFDELKRIAESYRSNVSIARSREADLDAKLEEAKARSTVANDDQVKLRELQRDAETYKNLVHAYQQRSQEAAQQATLPITEARVISEAVPALKPSSPKKGLSLAFAGLLGLMFGGGIGVLREWRERFFRTGDQVRSNLGLEFVGNVPLSRQGNRDTSTDPAPKIESDTVLGRKNSITNYVIDHPLSGFAETMRSAKIAVDLNSDRKKMKVVGLTSVFPGEGKSTVSINFAQLIANEGNKVLLIDGDLRNPGATRAIARGAERGLVEALTTKTPISELIVRDPNTNLSFLPAIVTQRIPFSSELLASAAMDRVLADAAAEYDYVVIDLPPLGILVDARAISAKIDTYLMVVEWGRTPRAVVKKTLQTNLRVFEKCAGVVLNKVDTGKLGMYEGFGSNEYYSKHYTNYFKDPA